MSIIISFLNINGLNLHEYCLSQTAFLLEGLAFPFSILLNVVGVQELQQEDIDTKVLMSNQPPLAYLSIWSGLAL